MCFRNSSVVESNRTKGEYAAGYALQVDSIHTHGSKTYAVVYDLFPIEHPDWFDSAYFRQVFTEWHEMLCTKVDGILCISHTRADHVARFYAASPFAREELVRFLEKGHTMVLDAFAKLPEEAAALAAWLASEAHPDSSRIPFHTWQDAAAIQKVLERNGRDDL